MDEFQETFTNPFNIKCTGCGAPAEYDIIHQNYHCQHCGATTELNAPVQALQRYRKNHAQELKAKNSQDKCSKYNCPNCGAPVKKLGYKNFIELGYLRLGRTDYDAKKVKGYREQIEEVVNPITQKLWKKQVKSLGIKKPQYYDYNLRYLEGNPTPDGDSKYLTNAALKMYKAMSKESGEFFTMMVDNHLLDLDARAGKTSGGYCTYFPRYKAPFIFSNFNGTEGDINVLTHEGGHAFQAYLSSSIKIPEYQSPTLESCEIHSMSMEFFAEPYMQYFFDNPDKYRYVHLADSISFLPYGVTVDEFQHWVYANPDATPAERDAKWHELEVKYTPYKVKEYKGCKYMEEGHRWLTQNHIFASPFYYIDYTLAQVIAFEFFNLDRKNHEKAWKKYMKLCKMGGKYPFVTLINNVGLKSPFEPGVLKKTVKPLVKVLKDYHPENF